jgi:hypothetical protein
MTRRTRLLMQLAAVVALVTLLGLLLIAVSVVAENPDELVIAFVFLLVVASFGWLVLTSRGLRLLIGLTAFSLGVVALVLQLSVDGFLLIGLLIAAVAIFGTSARFAVGRDRRTLHATHLASRAPPARRGVLIINPNSGGGKAQRFNLANEARKRRIEPLCYEPGDDLRELATYAVSEGVSRPGTATFCWPGGCVERTGRVAGRRFAGGIEPTLRTWMRRARPLQALFVVILENKRLFLQVFHGASRARTGDLLGAIQLLY